jgi:hypothetical protein
MKALFAFLLFLSMGFSPADTVRISDFYKDAKVGQWILMKSTDGLETRTSVTAKGDGKITLRIQSYKDKRQISDSEQVIDALAGKVLSIKIFDEGTFKEIIPEESEIDHFFRLEFKHIAEEKVKVIKGAFTCQKYRAVYNDRVVRAWLNDDVPILHLVKIAMQGGTVQLADYGDDSV